MMPSGLSFGNLGSNQGSPTRMEMGQGGAVNTSTAAEVPVPNTPPGADEVVGRTFGLQSNGSANVGIGNVAGSAGNLGVVGNFGNVSNSGGVGCLAGSFGPATNLSGVPSAGCPYPSMSLQTQLVTRAFSCLFKPKVCIKHTANLDKSAT